MNISLWVVCTLLGLCMCFEFLRAYKWANWRSIGLCNLCLSKSNVEYLSLNRLKLNIFFFCLFVCSLLVYSFWFATSAKKPYFFFLVCFAFGCCDVNIILILIFVFCFSFFAIAKIVQCNSLIHKKICRQRNGSEPFA